MHGCEFLVQHGVAGFLGRFRSDTPFVLSRGAPVVVRGRRGLEVGRALSQAVSDWSGLGDSFIGELLRPATNDDLDASEQAHRFGQVVYEDAAARAARDEWPLSFVDVEAALDHRSIVLHALRIAPCDEGPLLESLGTRHNAIVRLYELNAPRAEHGCGACGSEGGCGSCGAGGCGSCSAGAADELATYFARLRAEMEERRLRLL